MNTLNRRVSTLMLFAPFLVIAAIAHPSLAIGKPLPGFETLSWGMSQDQVVKALQKLGKVDTAKIDNGDGTWIGAIYGGKFKIGGYTFKSATFFFDGNTNSLRAHSSRYMMREFIEYMQITEAMEGQFEEVSPSRRTDREAMHFTYTDGDSFLHLIQYNRQRSDKMLTVRLTQD